MLALLAFVAFAVLAIATAKGAKWKALNALIIIGFMATGLGIGALLGVWGGNMEIGGHAAIPLAELLGVVGGLGCWRRNKWREKRSAIPSADSTTS